MIINTLNSNKIKIIIDENDLKNSEISLKEWISNPRKTNIFLKKLLILDSNYKNNISFSKMNFINYKEFTIFTYNFKIFSIEILL